MKYKIINGNNLEILDTLEPNSIDACITDPPYELGFMGKKWDSTGIAYNVELWKKVLKVLKPGAYLLAFGGTRTFHRIACAIEDAGFEIRDTIMWLYGSGFPKSHNVGLAIDELNGVESQVIGKGKSGDGSTHIRTMSSITKEGKSAFGGEYDIRKANNKWSGWGTCLKPAYEPIIMARKPIEDTIAQNVLKYGTGAINIDECRVEYENTQNPATNPLYRQENKDKYKQIKGGEKSEGAVSWTSGKNGVSNLGRFPANVITDGSDEVKENMPDTKGTDNIRHNNNEISQKNRINQGKEIVFGLKNCDSFGFNDEGSACRYFYCAKASKKDRDEGLDMFEEKLITDGSIRSNSHTAGAYGANMAVKKNIHPTVKPVELMQYLIRLITPRGG